MNFTITITLGAGEKGKQWNDLVRHYAKKNRLSIGAYVRSCIYDRIKKEMPSGAPKVEEPKAPAEPLA
jgi:hypothetical protein